MSDAQNFEAILYPNRSGTFQSVFVFLTLLTMMSVAVALYYVSLGAWPVAVFTAVELALIALCFRAIHDSGKSYERIVLNKDSLIVEDHAYSFLKQKYQERRWRLQPFWTRVELVDLPGEDNRLYLKSQTQALSIGEYMTAQERAEFADVLSARLFAHKNP